MATTTTRQIIAEDPAIEAYRKGLLESVNQFVRERISKGLVPPDFQVQQLSAPERQAIDLARSGVGAYQPFLQGATGDLNQGQQFLGQAANLAAAMRPATFAYQSAARDAAQGGLGQYDPRASGGVAAFMNPYEQQVIDRTMSDLQRASNIARQGEDAQAVGSGAFGGSRQAILQAERGRNLLDAQRKAAEGIRMQGFQQAAQQAQQAFEQARARQLQGAGLMGQLGVDYGRLGLQDVAQLGQLGSQFGTMGLQRAGLGEMGAKLRSQDLQNLATLGQLERGVGQATLDALRATNLQRYQQPYQQYGFLSDIYKGTPTSQATTTMQITPNTSPFQQIAGLGIAGLAAAGGAKEAGLF